MRTRVPRGDRPAHGLSLAGSHLQATCATNQVKAARPRMIVGVRSPGPPRFACPTCKAEAPHARRVSYSLAAGTDRRVDLQLVQPDQTSEGSV